jgi:hypothetical protein
MVLNPDYPAFKPCQLPSELEARFAKLGIHLHFNPQRLHPECMDIICVSDICGIVFRSTVDLLEYQGLLPSAKPFQLCKTSSQLANVEGQSITIMKAFGPIRMQLYNVLFTASDVVQALLTQHGTTGQLTRQTHHIGLKQDEKRFVASKLLAHQSFASINRGNPI